MRLYITQNSYYFVHKHFIKYFEDKDSEVLYVTEDKRGIFKKYSEIIYYLGSFNFLISILSEFYYWFKLSQRKGNLSSSTIQDYNLNKYLEEILSSGKYRQLISLGCPCFINPNLKYKYNVTIYNLHGGLIPFQVGRFSPIKAIQNNHKYLGATLHHISNTFDNGDIVSQNYFIIKDSNILANYSKVLSLSSTILDSYLHGQTFKVPTKIISSLLQKVSV